MMTSDELEIGEGDLTIRHAGTVTVIPTPTGVSEIAFRNALAVVYTLWMRNGQFPSVVEAWVEFERIPENTYALIFASKEFEQACQARGIKADPSAGLSLEQRMVLTKLADVTDTRNLRVQLKELGVTMPQYQGWLRDPLFFGLLEKASKDAYGDSLPTLRNVIVGQALSGSLEHQKIVLAKTGEYVPGGNEDAAIILRKLLDAIMKHADTDTRRAILNDIGSDMLMHSISHRKELAQSDG